MHTLDADHFNSDYFFFNCVCFFITGMLLTSSQEKKKTRIITVNTHEISSNMLTTISSLIQFMFEVLLTNAKNANILILTTSQLYSIRHTFALYFINIILFHRKSTT